MEYNAANEILADFAQAKIRIEGNLVADPDNNGSFYAFVPITHNDRGHQSPSKFQLSQASKAIEEKGFYINFILLEGKNKAVEASVKVALEKRFEPPR